jgi:hypothetical protein
MIEPQETNWLDLRRRGIWIIVFLAVSIGIMSVGVFMPVNRIEAITTYQDLQNQFQYVATLPGIFGNNFFHALIMFTPFIGPLYGALVFFNTGYVVAILAAGAPTPINAGLLFANLFLYPHTWLELFAYSLALSQSVFLAMAIVKGRFKQEAIRTCVIIAICALILLLAAVLELILIAIS